MGCMTDEPAVVIASSSDQQRAQDMVAALQKATIMASVMASGYVAGEFDVIVFANDAEAARAVLEFFQDS